MNEEFIKESRFIDKTEEELNTELIKSIIKAKIDLENANQNYEFADGELIDYYLYQMKANQSKLNYLLQKAKKYGVIVDVVKQIQIRKEKFLEDTNAV